MYVWKMFVVCLVLKISLLVCDDTCAVPASVLDLLHSKNKHTYSCSLMYACMCVKFFKCLCSPVIGCDFFRFVFVATPYPIGRFIWRRKLLQARNRKSFHIYWKATLRQRVHFALKVCSEVLCFGIHTYILACLWFSFYIRTRIFFLSLCI